MERVEVNDRQYELQKALKELTKYVIKNERKTLFCHLDSQHHEVVIKMSLCI
jgi:hypothetical protein